MPEPRVTDELSQLRGALVGRYRIERAIGAGGMATVYLAHDERHDRRVAIKVLKPEFAAAIGATRFLHEIKVTAALQHPHILPLFDSGEARAEGAAEGSGPVYYVMPFVEGESLRARLDRLTQLPVREALDIARAVASALDHAHQRGIIHRDIKPENILLAGEARDGVSGMQALVADFGIAVAVESPGTGRLTASGLSVGTPSYMSPEQASAERQIGPASDIFALGVVLYEMLSGEPPFTGPTAQAVVARMMTETPAPVRLRRATVSPRVEAAVMRALAKSPADRPTSAAQFADLLQSDEYPVPDDAPAGAPRGRRLVAWLPWGVAGAATLLATALLLSDRSGSAPGDADATRAGASHFAIALPEGATALDWRLGVAISPDGKALAFVANNPQGRRQLYMKRLYEPNSNAMPGTEDGAFPFFSPDGVSLGFVTSSNELKTIALASGTVSLRADSVFSYSARWSSDGAILLDGFGKGMVRLADAGGRTALTSVDRGRGELRHFSPQFLPDGRALLYSVEANTPSGVGYRVMVRPDSSSAARVLIEGAAFTEYLGDGQLLYQKGGELLVASIDLRSLTAAGSRRVVGGVAPINRIDLGRPWSVAGDILLYGSDAGLARSLVWVDRSGGREALPAAPDWFQSIELSPDGRHAVTTINDNGRIDVSLYDISQDVLTPLTHDGVTVGATWGPEPGLLTTTNIGAGRFSGLVIRADGTGTPVPLVSGAVGKFLWAADWARDGRSLVLMDGGDISVLEPGSGAARRPVVSTAGNDLGGRVSPDNRWIAYFSDVTGRFELYVTPFPAGGDSWRVTRNGAREAVWSRDGRELFFRSENGWQLLRTVVGAGTTFAASAPEVLFEGDYFSAGGPGACSYDVSPDGKRFLMLQRAGTGSGHLNVVLGWKPSAL